MQQIQALIQKYWAGTATKEETDFLWEWLSTHDTDLKEWLEAQYHEDHASQRQHLPESRSAALLQEILHKKEQRSAPVLPIRRGRRWMGWAAAVVLLLTGGLFFTYVSRHAFHQPNTVAEIKAPVLPQLTNVTNPGPTEMVLTLSDQSIIRLQPHSSIAYYQPFDSARRDISLVGKAFFKVAKDPVRSFAVYAGDVVTTVLGTQFSVSTLLPGKVEVKLFEGKVKVAGNGQSLTMKEIYLVPGQQFLLDMQQRQFAISAFEQDLTRHKGVGVNDKMTLTFSKEPLKNVFEKVGQQYGLHFIYDQQEMKHLCFSGTFLPSDSLETVIAVICNMNDLTFKRDQNNIIITKLK